MSHADLEVEPDPLELEGGHRLFVCEADHYHNNTLSHCMFCDGGLTACSRCNAFEGAWTSECPGIPVPQATWDRVYAGELDYVDGRWVAQPSPVALPNGRAAVERRIQQQAQALGWDHVEFFTVPFEPARPGSTTSAHYGYVGRSLEERQDGDERV